MPAAVNTLPPTAHIEVEALMELRQRYEWWLRLKFTTDPERELARTKIQLIDARLDEWTTEAVGPATFAMFVKGDEGWEFKGFTDSVTEAGEHVRLYGGSQFKVRVHTLF